MHALAHKLNFVNARYNSNEKIARFAKLFYRHFSMSLSAIATHLTVIVKSLERPNSLHTHDVPFESVRKS